MWAAQPRSGRKLFHTFVHTVYPWKISLLQTPNPPPKSCSAPALVYLMIMLTLAVLPIELLHWVCRIFDSLDDYQNLINTCKHLREVLGAKREVRHFWYRSIIVRCFALSRYGVF